MSSWKILLSDGLKSGGKEVLASKAEVIDWKGISAEELLAEIAQYDAVIVRGRTKMTADVIGKAKKLKVIGRCGVGVDNIDLDAAEAKGIIVVNAPSATTTSVAEHAMGLIFSLAREVPRADAGMKDGEWLKKDLIGTELNRKALGIIGYGKIGQRVGRFAAALGMKIIIEDRSKISPTALVESGEEVPFDQLLSSSDFITIHTPLVEKTKNMIDETAISKMKDGVFIVCTARGGIIDEKAILEGLKSGKIGGLALDVFASEPPTNRDLINHPKVIATPHIGGQTKEAQQRASVHIAREVLAALEGKKLRSRIV